MIWSVTVFADDDPIRALEFQFKNCDDASNFVGMIFDSAVDNITVSVMRKEKDGRHKFATIYNACTGERKEYDV